MCIVWKTVKCISPKSIREDKSVFSRALCTPCGCAYAALFNGYISSQTAACFPPLPHPDCNFHWTYLTMQLQHRSISMLIECLVLDRLVDTLISATIDPACVCLSDDSMLWQDQESKAVCTLQGCVDSHCRTEVFTLMRKTLWLLQRPLVCSSKTFFWMKSPKQATCCSLVSLCLLFTLVKVNIHIYSFLQSLVQFYPSHHFPILPSYTSSAYCWAFVSYISAFLLVKNLLTRSTVDAQKGDKIIQPGKRAFFS